MVATILAAERRMPAPARTAKTGPKSDIVRQWLLEQITTGAIARDQQLPSESDLISRFGVSRVTVRRALDDLRRSGMIEGRQGRGYFVRPVRTVQDLGRLQGFGEMMAALGVEVGSRVLASGEVAAPADVARALQVEKGAPVIRIARIRLAGGVPLSFDVSFFPVEVGRRLLPLDLAHQDIFRLLEAEIGIELGFADLRIEIMRGGDAEAIRHLGAASDEPILRIERLTRDIGGRPIDFEYLYGVADTFQFHVRVPRW